VVYASLFGVGAPEALVIGVVALLVFGPKGLAEVSLDVYLHDSFFGTILIFGRILNAFVYAVVNSLYFWYVYISLQKHCPY
jgi:hypothetical protein